MKLEILKNAVTSKVARQVLQVQKHSPALLFGAGVVGVVATAVLASKATLGLDEVLADGQAKEKLATELVHDRYSEADRKRDLATIKVQTGLKVAKLYAPAIAVGVVSVTALTGSHIILTRRNAAVMAAYSALDKGFNDYRARVREELGDDKDQEFRYGTDTITETRQAEDGTTERVDHKVISGRQPSVYAKFFDDGSSSWSPDPEYNRTFLSCQQEWASNKLRAQGHLFLNEVYDMLGLPRSKAGAVVGWVISKEGDNFVDFGIFNPDNPRGRMFVNGDEKSILLDFNVDGVIYDKI
jgi:hypothetical protein